jgi:pyrimidine deaminase RibD-like protein
VSAIIADAIALSQEPCSIRTSGLAPCADALIYAKVRKCLIGVAEPDDFVKCEGAQKLKEADIEVLWIKGMEKECLDVARRGRSTGGIAKFCCG